MFGRWFGHGERRIERTLAAVARARAEVEGVIGLPHVLSKDVIARRFGQQAAPSSEGFRADGISGEWRLPSPSPHLRVEVKGDDTGRLVLGLITGRDELAGLRLYTRWDRFAPVSAWQVQLLEPATALAAEIYARLGGDGRSEGAATSE